jgi:hypothetical protein
MIIDRIEHPIAEDTWRYKLQDGRIMSSRLIVGQPSQIKDDPNGDWICPVWIEHFTLKITPVYGVGPVDALMNAMKLVSSFFEKYKDSLTDIGTSNNKD